MILATQISKELEELQKDVTHHEAAAGLQSRCSPLKDALEVDSVFADGHLRQARARKSKHAKEPQQGITQIEVPSPSVRLQGSREQYHRGVAAGEGLEADDADVLDFWALPPRTPPPMRDPSTTSPSLHQLHLPRCCLVFTPQESMSLCMNFVSTI